MKERPVTQRLLAWSVHLFTASGLLAGFMAMLAINEKGWREAMLWLLLALFIDAIDGTFARLFRVRETLPFMDGKMIDYVVDFINYALVPAYFFYMVDLVPGYWGIGLTFLILMTSAIYYGKEGMVSDDMHFVGFPVLWNLIVFLLVFVITLPPVGNAVTIVFFAVLHFVPIKFAYPSRAIRFKNLTLAVSFFTLLAMFWAIWIFPEREGWLSGMVLAGILYYLGLALYETFWGD
ncbi:MAG: hypothetical protein R2828_05065 [Saprospiraceae bacterium]